MSKTNSFKKYLARSVDITNSLFSDLFMNYAIEISKENQKLIKLFLKEKGRKCSPATMKVYASDLNIFFCWNVLENDNKFYPNIKKVEISSFFDYLLNTMKINGKRFAHFKSILSGLSDCVIKFYDEDYPTFRNS